MYEAPTNDLPSGLNTNQIDIYIKPKEQVENINTENPYILVGCQNNLSSYYIPHGKANLCLCIYLCFFLLPISPLFVCIILFGLTKGLEFKKVSEDKIIATESGYSCYSKRYNFSKYTLVKVESNERSAAVCCNKIESLQNISLYNNNLDEIDLDNSNIKNIPFKFVHKFTGNIGTTPEIQLNLSKFFSGVFENKIGEELKKYRPHKMVIPHFPLEEQFLKLNDNFYTFYTSSKFPFPPETTPEAFKRLDWVYSKNFDRIFIGVVKNDTTYLNSKTYQISEIDKFVFIMKNQGYVFQVLLKEGNFIDICTFYHQKDYILNTFIYLINGQFNSKLNNNNDIPPANIPTLQ